MSCKEIAYTLYFQYMKKWRRRKDLQSFSRKEGDRESAQEHERFASEYQSAAKVIAKTFNLKFNQ